MPVSPRLPPRAAAGNSIGLPASPLLPEAATGSTSLKKAAASARAWLRVKPRPARLMLMTSAPERIENSIPRIRSLTLKLPSREARTATSRVEPATPLPPHAVAVDRGDQPADEGAVADEVAHVGVAGARVETARDPAGELGMS